ncbi:zinc metallopeptidase [Halomonas llamarensis]|uniref:Zinc metallopeptidase n=1 Tax=Halomonas llamarensis TaxID=2945104 RepID=A0ABT0SSL0_9GAMM|nr:zinc metallopeptidase [Halomonas llamarensis]MCL7930568.1 zinc metallopeptidase [Halomonas llamarensis]
MIVVLIVFLLAIFVLPNLWAKWVLKRHTRGRNDYPGTGAELADHLLRRFGVEGVKVERTEQGDHYDPEARRVRLSSGHYDGRSLTAVTVAAHEVGHAIQHYEGYTPLIARSRLVKLAQKAEKVGAILMMAAPFLFILTRLPGGLALVVGMAVVSFGTAAVVHLVTLPVEFDASFNRALPMLKDYVPPYDMPGARHVLTACAFTYVAASLASVMNLGRWLVILRR